MSFCSNQTADRCPGNISGNPMNGLCERVCVNVPKVFDACMTQSTLENVTLTLSNITPPNPTLPLTFVSGASTSSTGTITSLTVTPISDRPGLSRVQATVQIPVIISYTDADGVAGTGTGFITVSQDIIMCVPTGSVITPGIVATVNATIPQGTFTSGTECTVTACVTLILKVQADVDLLVPSYGYCRIPQCTEYTQDVCQGVFDLPLFPS